MDQKILTVAFLRPGGDDHWMNQMTAKASRFPFCHVELFFEGENGCFSIVWGESVGFRPKNLSNPKYQLVSLGVSAREYNSCLEFCRSLSTQGIQFDDCGMWRSWFPQAISCVCCDGSSHKKGRTFCSKVITEALQFGGVAEVRGLVPAAVTPSRLYERLFSSSRVICCGVPYRRHALMHMGAFPPITVRML
jgi:hypothetical protein